MPLISLPLISPTTKIPNVKGNQKSHKLHHLLYRNYNTLEVFCMICLISLKTMDSSLPHYAGAYKRLGRL